ncbi:MFS transporter [Enterobacter hormaechei]
MASNVWFISLAVFWGLITIGIQLVCLPLQVHDILGFDLVTVGWVMGMQSVATLLSRPWAGRVTDRLGGKRAVTLGFVAIAVAGGL